MGLDLGSQGSGDTALQEVVTPGVLPQVAIAWYPECHDSEEHTHRHQLSVLWGR